MSGHPQCFDPAAWHLDMILNAWEGEADLCKNFPWNHVDIQFRSRVHTGRIDLMRGKDCTGDVLLSWASQLGSVSITSNQKRCLFSLACTCSQQSLSSQQLTPVREMSTASTPSPSCKQIMLRGLDDVCVRNEIVWNQFWWPHCAVLGPPPADAHGACRQKLSSSGRKLLMHS